MIKVTMNLTERDVENAEVIRTATAARSRAQAVSIALSLTRFLVDELVRSPGTKILLRHEDDTTERVVMPELQNVRVTPEILDEKVEALREEITQASEAATG